MANEDFRNYEVQATLVFTIPVRANSPEDAVAHVQGMIDKHSIWSKGDLLSLEVRP